jgi:hypothetical protein
MRTKRALGRGHQPRLDDVDTPNAVLAGNVVEGLEELERAGDGLAALHLELDGDTLLEGDRAGLDNMRSADAMSLSK